ncbi:tyrosyl-DNA phosphodiesterase 1, variant 2 [Stylosanthes scabra]|uniref:Tyrosyl-DNA phosphodiesterase 1, variant 2 n=1 Tax=Stylosanthes scabra TaxID=79078 RepID=A0ABU6X7I4_9FABA|nr:tyrosyl-DNA phosphodiesterase 1, variant 2 [Stylosanthes scabra]
MSREVGFLVPLNHNLEEHPSAPKLPISHGPNPIGRTNIPLPTPDKRLSRNHLTLTASPHGDAHLLVEGRNPIVLNSGNKRRKLNSHQKAPISHGDILELIPGHHLFKYQVLSNTPASVTATTKKEDSHRLSQEQGRNAAAHKPGHSQSGKYSNAEAIRNFHIPSDKIPSTFRLLRVQQLPPWANTSCVAIDDVIQGDVLVAILSNYMVDLDWLLPACPALSKVPHVLVIHGESDGRVEYLKRSKPANWILHKPPLPISFGTHHSKAMFLVYPQGIRVIVHTANLIHVDWNNKTQGLWLQDFPWKDQDSLSKGSEFENDLVEYLSTLKWPEFSVKLPSLGNFSICPSFFKKFDYSDAMVRLIASAPGYHSGAAIKKWGHMKLRSLLQECTFDEDFKKSPLIYQFSSLGSLDEKWMAELTSSMSAGLSEDKTPLGLGEPQIIWPTVEDVRCSIEGYAAGSAIPSPFKNVEKAFLKKYWAKWKADHTGRSRAMPHIKTFTRYSGQNLAWFLLTSANLSKAAWGALQKNNTQFMIRSYELGVLFLPTLLKRGSRGFSCTNNITQTEVAETERERERELLFDMV